VASKSNFCRQLDEEVGAGYEIPREDHEQTYSEDDNREVPKGTTAVKIP